MLKQNDSFDMFHLQEVLSCFNQGLFGISVYLVNHEKTFVPKMNAPYISQALTFFLSLFQLAHYNRAEAYLGPCQKSVVERFCENN